MILFAQFFSFLFHPVVFFLLMPFLVVYRQTASGFYALKWQVFSSLFVFLGMLVFLLGRWRGHFSDIDLANKEERTKFYMYLAPLMTAYIVAAVFFKGVLFPLSLITIAIFLGLALFEALNRYTKASIHVCTAAAFGISLGILYGRDFFLLGALIVSTVIWSRLLLKKHTAIEVIEGAALGIGITLLTFLIGKYFYKLS